MGLESLIDWGKKALVGLGLISLASCVPTTYAKRDYERYPAYKKEIALYNIKEIAKDVCFSGPAFVINYPVIKPKCEEMKIDESGISYIKRKCVDIRHDYTQHRVYCGNDVQERHSFSWWEIKGVRVIDEKVIVSLREGEVDMEGFKDSRQAADFAEALRIYIQN